MFDDRGTHREKSSDTVTPTLNAFDQPLTFNVAFDWQSGGDNRMSIGLPNLQVHQVPAVARSLTSRNERMDGETENFIVSAIDARNSCEQPNNVSGTLQSKKTSGYSLSYTNPVARQQNTRDEVRLIGGDGNIAGALSAEAGMKQQNYIGVRRLTPIECERLQGFPDGWTDGFSDGVRYRMLGNAVAVPCTEWIGNRILRAD